MEQKVSITEPELFGKVQGEEVHTVKSEEKKPVNNPHDKGYKKDLGKPKEFLHFLQKYVKASWAMDLDVTQLRSCDKEFISKDYEGKEADLVYEITLGSRKKLYAFILQELQSSVDYTMIFRIVMYVMDILYRYFMNTPKNERERADFQLPAVVPIVFYNGADTWTAARRFRDYQMQGELFGEYVLNLEYYLVDLNEIQEDYILTTNTMLDNIMYCDKFRKRSELANAVRTAYRRVRELGNQEIEEFENWVKNILLTVSEDKKSLVKEILEWARNGDDDMAFKYNITRMFEDERAEGRAEGEWLKVTSQLQKKWQKGKSVSDAADDLEEEMSVIQPFYDLISQYPDESAEEIFARYNALHQNEA